MLHKKFRLQPMFESVETMGRRGCLAANSKCWKRQMPKFLRWWIR